LGKDPLIKVEELPSTVPDTLNKTLAWAVWGVGQGLDSLGDFGEKGYAKSSQLLIKAIPPDIKSKFQSIKGDSAWVSEFLSLPHQRITGGTGSGKSKLLGLVISQWLERNQDGQLFIADPNYGKPDPDGFLNNWFGLDSKWIKQPDDEIDALIDHVHTQLDERIKACVDGARNGAKKISEIEVDLTPICLICEEFDSIVERYKKDKSDRFEKLVEIIKQGRGYKIKLIPVGQSASVGEGGFTLATLENLAQLIICYPAIPESQLKYLGGAKDELTALAERLLKDGKRPAICTIKGQSRVVTIPDLSGFNITFANNNPTDPDGDWWATVNNDTFQSSLELRAFKYSMGLIQSPLKQICSELGIEPRSTNKRYTSYLKPAWESQLSQAKTLVNK
ncbi:MAG TPA: type IV secretory system conjugative DNA transfer family protein, partial [Candidatus Obscuribacterales bacterium]